MASLRILFVKPGFYKKLFLRVARPDRGRAPRRACCLSCPPSPRAVNVARSSLLSQQFQSALQCRAKAARHWAMWYTGRGSGEDPPGVGESTPPRHRIWQTGDHAADAAAGWCLRRGALRLHGYSLRPQLPPWVAWRPHVARPQGHASLAAAAIGRPFRSGLFPSPETPSLAVVRTATVGQS